MPPIASAESASRQVVPPPTCRLMAGLAVLSDKQKGLVPAVAAVLSDTRHQFCQAHYLQNLAEPLAEAERLAALRQVPPAKLEEEQQRFRQHQERFRLHTRST